MPPSTHLALLRAEGTNAEEQEQFLKDRLNEIDSPQIETFGPIPAPIERVSNRWRYQAALISDSRAELHSRCVRSKDTLPFAARFDGRLMSILLECLSPGSLLRPT